MTMWARLMRSGRQHPLRWLVFGLGLAAFAVGVNVAISTWIKGDWGRDNAAMRYLFQCSGTLADEQARWEPRKVLVSACQKPIIADVSPSGRLAAVVAEQPEWETMVLDAKSGDIVLSLEGPRDILALSDTLIYYSIGLRDQALYDLVFHQELPITKLPFQSEDVSALEAARIESGGDFEYYDGEVTLLAFHTPSGRRVFDIEGLNHDTFLKLIDDWYLETRLVVATTDRPSNSPFRGGSRSCVIGRINPDLAGPGLLEQFFAHVCWFEYTNPILLDP